MALVTPLLVFHMLSRITHNVIVTDRVQDIEKCAKIVLPGVGSFDAIMEKNSFSRFV